MTNKTQTDGSSPAPLGGQRKQLKKQAKREARAMHALDQARQDLQKAERKLARAQRDLQKRQDDLQACAANLEKIRSSSHPEGANLGPPVMFEIEQSIVLEVVGAEGEEHVDQGAMAQEEVLAPLFDPNAATELIEPGAEKTPAEPGEEGHAGEDIALADLQLLTQQVPDGAALTAESEAAGSASPKIEVQDGSDTQAGVAGTDAVEPSAQPEARRSPGTRRPRNSATPRRRSPSSRSKSNGTEKP